MSETKIQFSGAEMELMNNANIILTKNAVLQKIKMMLEELQQGMMHIAADEGYAGDTVFQESGKISRGENYGGLPYLVLDFPRQFGLTDIFVIRTMFWWGHFFSVTLQLSGKYKDDCTDKIEDAYNLLVKRDFFIGVGDDPWQHHFEGDNYKPISECTEAEFKERCAQGEHLKIARHFKLWDVHFVGETLLDSWQFLVSLCIDQAPPNRWNKSFT